MTIEELYEILGLTFVKGSIFQEIAKDEANAAFVKSMEEVENRAEKLLELINNEPEGFVANEFDWKGYYNAVSDTLDHSLSLKLPEELKKDEAALNDFQYQLDQMDGQLDHEYGRHTERLKLLSEIARKMTTQDKIEKRKAHNRSAAEAERKNEEEAKRKAEEEIKKRLEDIKAQYIKDTQAHKEADKAFHAVTEQEYNTIGAFDSHVLNLESARYKKNSEAYEKIIKAVRFVNSNAQVPKGKNLNEIQNYTVKLLVIKNSINDYIAHKAKDGVNKNSYDKLAAVEKLNVEVSKRLSELQSMGVPAFYMGEKKVDLSALPITEKQEWDKAKKANPRSKYTIKPSAIVDPVDDCMCRIITKAVEKKYTGFTIRGFEKMRTVFAKMDDPVALVHTNEGPGLLK